MYYVHLHSLIKRINMYINMYSFNQTIVSLIGHLMDILVYTSRFHKMFGDGNLV